MCAKITLPMPAHDLWGTALASALIVLADSSAARVPNTRPATLVGSPSRRASVCARLTNHDVAYSVETFSVCSE